MIITYTKIFFLNIFSFFITFHKQKKGKEYHNHIINVLKTGPMTEPEKLPIHGSLVGPVVEPRLNR